MNIKFFSFFIIFSFNINLKMSQIEECSGDVADESGIEFKLVEDIQDEFTHDCETAECFVKPFWCSCGNGLTCATHRYDTWEAKSKHEINLESDAIRRKQAADNMETAALNLKLDKVAATYANRSN